MDLSYGGGVRCLLRKCTMLGGSLREGASETDQMVNLLGTHLPGRQRQEALLTSLASEANYIGELKVQ